MKNSFSKDFLIKLAPLVKELRVSTEEIIL